MYDGRGNDLITDYKSGQDKIMFSDNVTYTSSISGKNVVFNVDGNILTVKGAANKKITIVDSEGSIISNNKYTKSLSYEEHNLIDENYWFATNDNFATNDLDLVMNNETTYSIGNLDFTINNVQLTNDNETFITYTENKNKN